MKKSVAAVMRLTEIADRLAELDKVETRSSAQDTEMSDLETEKGTVNSEFRDAAVAEEQAEAELRRHPRDFQQTPETREKLELRSKSRYGRMLARELLGRQLDGAEVEYRASLGITDGIPMDIFEQRSARGTRGRGDDGTGGGEWVSGLSVGAIHLQGLDRSA